MSNKGIYDIDECVSEVSSCWVEGNDYDVRTFY